MKRISIDVDKETIAELIPDLESGKYMLPSFQRQYVWDEDDVKERKGSDRFYSQQLPNRNCDPLETLYLFSF